MLFMETMGFVYFRKTSPLAEKLPEQTPRVVTFVVVVFSVLADAKKQKKEGKKRERTQMD